MTKAVFVNKPVLPLAVVDKVQKAQWCVGAAMGSCLACWFLPVVSGVACSLIEGKLIHKVLRILDCHTEEAAVKLYWFFRQKTFFLFGATYIPVAGVPLQVFETYGLGQFAIHCALRPELLTNDAWLEQSWQEVAPDIFSGEHAIAFYEQFSGQTFPEEHKKKFMSSVNFANRGYLLSQKVPGAAKAQEVLGKGFEQGMKLGYKALSGAGSVAASGFSSLKAARQRRKDAKRYR